MVGLCKNVGRVVTACAVVALAGIASAEQPEMFDGLAWDYAPQQGSPIVDRGAPCAIAANCQGAAGLAGYTGRSSDLVPLAGAPVANFGTSDNFTLTAGQTITSVCFWGFYGNVNFTAPAAGSEVFRLRFFANSTAGGIGHPGGAQQGVDFVCGAAGLERQGTVNGTLTRNSGTGIGVTNWTATLPAGGLTLPAGCYWVEIVGNTSTVHANDRFRWGVSDGPVNPNGSQDNVFHQKDNAAAPTAGQLVANAGDRAFCLNVALNTNACSIPPPPPNATCATAATITAPFTSASPISTVFAFNQATPFCGFNPVNGNTVWYRVVGNGQTFRAHTCGAGTDFDTVINVYCRTATVCGTSNANLNCVANNDTGPAACTGTGAAADPSDVSWASAPGVEYLIAVFGFQLTAGFFDFSLTSTAAAAGPACVTDRCSLVTTGITPVEVDACGVSTNSSCAGAGVGTFTFGDDFRGVCYNLGTSRDFDFWECASVVPDSVGDGSAWLDVDYAVEFPGIFNFFTGACGATNGTFLGGAFANYLDGGPACPRTQQTIQLQTGAGAPFRLNLLTVDFGGVPCASTFNDYIITVRVSTLGACCIPASACFLTVRDDCVEIQGGTFLAASLTCGPTDPCVAPVLGACCCGTTCSLMTLANCAGSNIAYKGDNTVCNAPGNNTTPCCKGDYNQSGAVGVQDIFDFLAGYFAGNPCADISGGGVGVQDIFDFLAAYFAGCP